jgi:hypothetical protein
VSDQHVHVEVPCGAPFARVARTVVAACGVMEGFSVDELGDIRLLVNEVFVAMHELGARRVEMVMGPFAGRLTVTMTALGPVGPGPGDVDTTFARALATTVARDVRFEMDAPRPHFAATFVAIDAPSG